MHLRTTCCKCVKLRQVLMRWTVALVKLWDALRTYGPGHNPIEVYIGEFTGSMVNTGKMRDPNFNSAGYCKAEENYVQELYSFALEDACTVLGMEMDFFSAIAYPYEPDPKEQ